MANFSKTDATFVASPGVRHQCLQHSSASIRLLPEIVSAAGSEPRRTRRCPVGLKLQMKEQCVLARSSCKAKRFESVQLGNLLYCWQLKWRWPVQKMSMPGRIPYITRTSLWNAWKAIRKELRGASCRDVVDYLEYDVDPDVWINRLLRQISQAQYEPSTPTRFTLGRSLGFSRTMTFPAVPDLVLYRAIVDFIYRRARRREQPHVYFKRDTLFKVQQKAAEEAIETMKDAAGDYRRIEEKRFLTWL